MRKQSNQIHLLIVFGFFFITACNNNKKQEMKSNSSVTESATTIFPKGEKLPNDWFTGNAYLYPLLSKDKNNEFALGCVTFEPGARTNWHTHPKGQVLIVVEGNGCYQQKGKSMQIIKKGDVVNIPENVEHWHGATGHTTMAHIAITNYKGEENVVWLKPVSDEEYKEATSK